MKRLASFIRKLFKSRPPTDEEYYSYNKTYTPDMIRRYGYHSTINTGHHPVKYTKHT